MSVSGRLYYVTTSGWRRWRLFLMYQTVHQFNKYCMPLTLKDVPCILTYALGSAACQTVRVLRFFAGGGAGWGQKLLSSLLNVHALHSGILNKQESGLERESGGSGSLPCRSHLIMTNFKKKFSPWLPVWKMRRRGPLCACVSRI